MRFVVVIALAFMFPLGACSSPVPPDATDGGQAYEGGEPDGCAPVGTTIFSCDPQPVDAGGCNIQPDQACNSSGCDPARQASLPHLDASYPVGCGVWVSTWATPVPPNHCWAACSCIDNREAGATVGPAWNCPL
jgi:hypothetical protein